MRPLLRRAGPALLVLAGLAAACALAGPAPKPPPFRLGDAATPLAYAARLEIDPGATGFTGEIRIDFAVNRAVPVLWMNAMKLDVVSADIRQGGRRIAVDVVPAAEDFVGFAARVSAFEPGAATAVIRYRGLLDAVSTRGLFRQQERGEWYVLSQFEALSARRAFPCFDEPGWKTPWTLTIDAPAEHVVVSNTPEASVDEVPGRPGWKRRTFATTKPLPTYLVALAVGPFDVVDGGVAGRKKTPLRYLAPKGRGAETRWAKEVTPRLLEMLEDYFGTPYPFEKLDSVTIPQAVTFGAMENVGLVTYGPRLLLATPREETEGYRRRYAGIASHEIAHMWFGNLVTLAWWDDIWLNEAFATWMGHKTQYRYRPEWDTGVYHAYRRNRAIGIDRLAAARRVRNPVRVKEDMGGAFDAITYDKGGEVLQMFEDWLTPERFRQGVRNYLSRHAWGTATSADFFAALGEASGRRREVLEAFSTFVDQPGVPLLDVALGCEGAPVLEVSQRRLRPVGSKAGDLEWTTPACFRFGADGRVHTQCERITRRPRRFALAGISSCPDWVLGNADGAGHYVVRYDGALAKRNAARIAELPAHEAIALLGDHAILAQSGLVPAETALDWAQAGLTHPAWSVRQQAFALLEKQRDALSSVEQLTRKRSIVAAHIEPLARELGWRERQGEPLELRDLRPYLLPFAAEYESGLSLRAEARSLALAWIRDRQAVEPPMVEAVMRVAGRFADRETYDRMESAALAAADRHERAPLVDGLAKVADPALRARALGLAIRTGRGAELLHGQDAFALLEAALSDELNARPAFAFVRANFDALVAKLPQHSPARFATALEGLCTPEDREAFVAFFAPRAGRFFGGRRRYAEALETIDLCIAARRAAGGH